MTAMRILSAVQGILEKGRDRSTPVIHWMATSLSRTVLTALAIVLAASSLVFLIFFVGIYQDQLERERMNALAQVNRLLQVSLENAMLKRDLPGLRDIVNRLGDQPEILNVMIVNPRKEVRFSSDQTALGQRLNMHDLGCSECSDDILVPPNIAQFIKIDEDKEVLRSVNPVMNKADCTQCHGDLETHPINGILIVERDASGIRRQAFLSAVMFSSAGICVVLLVLAATWFMLRSTVIVPIAQLTRTSRQLAKGNLKIRAGGRTVRKDEIGVLYASFDAMAAQIEKSLEEIRGKEAFLQALIDTIPDGVRVIDEDYRIVMVNRAYCAQMQGPIEELIGVPCFTAHGRAEPCIPTLTVCPFHASCGDGQTLKYMHTHQRADGTKFQVEITAARLMTNWKDKPCTLIIEVCRDLTQLVRYSQEQRLAELGQLATGVAHEIYNPLASVRLGLQSILKKISRGNPVVDQIAKYLVTVDGEVDKCIEVTKRLLILSMPPSERVQLVSFTAIIPEIISLLQYEADRLGIEIDVDLGNHDLRVVARDSELRMLVLNIVQNAFHAMPEGGKLAIRGAVRSGQVVIEIEDTGVGIAPADLPQIFYPFFSKRADGVTGTGLGLTISKAIVTRYKGSLDVWSTFGKGALFTIALPAANEEFTP